MRFEFSDWVRILIYSILAFEALGNNRCKSRSFHGSCNLIIGVCTNCFQKLTVMLLRRLTALVQQEQRISDHFFMSLNLYVSSHCSGSLLVMIRLQKCLVPLSTCTFLLSRFLRPENGCILTSTAFNKQGLRRNFPDYLKYMFNHLRYPN